ncbi:MAG: phenylphosphate carboxylase subunit delta [Blastopirellula sp.]|nr:MAG: phenylphosphate carboxylase subunit delta [Blastopirellula sp.]
MKLVELCQPIRLLLCDVDGVMTSGQVILDNQGIETKQFNIRDGLGIMLWKKADLDFGIITGRSSQSVRLRATELSIDIVRQGIQHKLKTAEELVEQLKLTPDQVAYIGDDLPDLPVIRWAGLGVAVADAADEVKAGANHQTAACGGQGAVRELIETILKAQQRWEELIQHY